MANIFFKSCITRLNKVHEKILSNFRIEVSFILYCYCRKCFKCIYLHDPESVQLVVGDAVADELDDGLELVAVLRLVDVAALDGQREHSFAHNPLDEHLVANRDLLGAIAIVVSIALIAHAHRRRL